MKNKILIYLFSFSLLVSCDPVMAQVKAMQGTIPSTAGGLPSGSTSISCNGVTAAYLYVKPATEAFKQASFQILATRVSTGMIGNCLLQGSNDGINYIALSTADSIHIANGATDTGDRFLVLTSGGTAHPDEGVNNAYYRLKCTQIAGDTCTVKGYANFRQ